MHARVVTLKVTSETAAEAVRRYDESIENSKRTPGYKMGILLTNPIRARVSQSLCGRQKSRCWNAIRTATTPSR